MKRTKYGRQLHDVVTSRQDARKLMLREYETALHEKHERLPTAQCMVCALFVYRVKTAAIVLCVCGSGIPKERPTSFSPELLRKMKSLKEVAESARNRTGLK